MSYFTKEIWIAQYDKENSYSDDNGSEIPVYKEPQRYDMNYQPASGYTSYLKHGMQIDDVYIAMVDRKAFQGKVIVGDRAYLSDGEVAEEDLEKLVLSDNNLCLKANYKVVSVLPQLIKTIIEFK